MKELPLDDKIGGTYMPLINITLGATTEEQKKEIIEKSDKNNGGYNQDTRR